MQTIKKNPSGHAVQKEGFYAGSFSPIGTITSDQFIKMINSKVEFNFRSFKEKLAEKLLPIKTLLKKSENKDRNESDFHALVHGVLSGLPASNKIDEDNVILGVFSEPSLSVAGRIDLAVALGVENNNAKIIKEKLYILELKFATSEANATKQCERGFDQASKYLENAKSLIDAKEADLIALVLNSAARSKEKLLLMKIDPHKRIDKSSADEAASSSQDEKVESQLEQQEIAEIPDLEIARSSQQGSDSLNVIDSSKLPRLPLSPRRSQNRGETDSSDAGNSRVIPLLIKSSVNEASSDSSDKRNKGRKRTFSGNKVVNPDSSSGSSQESQNTPPRKKRKYSSCKGKRSGSRPKRDIGVLQGLCVLNTQMLENKKRQQQRFHSLKGRLEQASLIIHNQDGISPYQIHLLRKVIYQR